MLIYTALVAYLSHPVRPYIPNNFWLLTFHILFLDQYDDTDCTCEILPFWLVIMTYWWLDWHAKRKLHLGQSGNLAPPIPNFFLWQAENDLGSINLTPLNLQARNDSSLPRPLRTALIIWHLLYKSFFFFLTQYVLNETLCH